MRRDQLNLGLAEHGLMSALRATALSAAFIGSYGMARRGSALMGWVRSA
jgi:hypothetical protein